MSRNSDPPAAAELEDATGLLDDVVRIRLTGRLGDQHWRLEAAREDPGSEGALGVTRRASERREGDTDRDDSEHPRHAHGGTVAEGVARAYASRA